MLILLGLVSACAYILTTVQVGCPDLLKARNASHGNADVLLRSVSMMCDGA